MFSSMVLVYLCLPSITYITGGFLKAQPLKIGLCAPLAEIYGRKKEFDGWCMCLSSLFPVWGVLEMGDPQVTIGFNTKSWSSMTWMRTGGTPMT